MTSVSPAPVSPSSASRLPSPPPFPEVQIGPKSPTAGLSPNPSQEDIGKEQGDDFGASRRIRPGTKTVDMASGPPMVPLADLDSPFQLQEHLMALFLHSTRSMDASMTIPVNRQSATKLATAPEGVDPDLWLYELCRLLVQRANSLIVGFFADSPPCSATNCPEMRASEWQYLCAVHDPPKSCCAIDYCCHTLDWAANILTSQKHFPSRLSLGSEASGGKRQLTNIFRRVYRMFAHAWFQHRDVFWQLENQEGLYVFYKTVCDIYGLIQEENYTVPPEAEGAAPEEPSGPETGKDTEPPKFERQTSLVERAKELLDPEVQGAEKTTLSTGATTRRHKQTPSTGSFVTTIQEGEEDGDEKKDGTAAGTTTFVNTVRRDPSSSPTKLSSLATPSLATPRIPDIELNSPGNTVMEGTDVSTLTPAISEVKVEEVQDEENKLERHLTGDTTVITAADPQPEKDVLTAEPESLDTENQSS